MKQVPATVGELRELIADMPDDAPVAPHWSPGFSPTDLTPVVQVDGLGRTKDALLVYVSCVDLEDLPDGEEE